MLRIFSVVLSFIMIVCLSATHAQSNDAMTIVTGSDTGTYVRFGNDIAAIVKQAPYKKQLNVLSTSGSIDNIKRISGGNGQVALGIVQSDILGFLSRSTSDNTRAIAKDLSLIFPFYEEEVHILARKDILGFRDLAGKRVVVGQEGSGNMLTAMNLLALADIEPAQTIHISPAEGVVSVLSNEADAMIFVGGKPLSLFSNLSDLKTAHGGENAHLLDAIHLVPIDDQRIFSEYLPTRINAGDYSFVDSTVLTAKVNAVLVAYDPQSIKTSNRDAYCDQIFAVSKAIAGNMEALKNTGHPKWENVNLFDNVAKWKKNECVWDGKTFLAAPAMKSLQPSTISDALSKDLLAVVRGKAR